jgi:hypothetical protein
MAVLDEGLQYLAVNSDACLSGASLADMHLTETRILWACILPGVHLVHVADIM